MKFSARSEANLVGVHPDLVKVMRLAIERTKVDFAITEGLRTKERQAELLAQNKSKTLNSRHITGHAIDFMAIVDGKGTWVWSYYETIANTIKECAKELGVEIDWGGDWKFRDGPHVELDWSSYP